eukprot:687281-Rhodomonas_salina.5
MSTSSESSPTNEYAFTTEHLFELSESNHQSNQPSVENTPPGSCFDFQRTGEEVEADIFAQLECSRFRDVFAHDWHRTMCRIRRDAANTIDPLTSLHCRHCRA